jgi:hypothetical protein
MAVTGVISVGDSWVMAIPRWQTTKLADLKSLVILLYKYCTNGRQSAQEYPKRSAAILIAQQHTQNWVD